MATDTLLKLRIWTKFVLLGLILLYCLMFVLFNRQHVDLWLFPFTPAVRTSLLVAILGAFALGALLTIFVRIFTGTIRQMRQAKERERTARLEREVADMRTKAATLRPRE